ncbi:MAG: ATP-dependent DNA helicase RecQ [Myxococcales bacterium]|nr:ATP-dependent DNA helicase RecQ [Myxococcales bacterium]MCB9630357.1 ATP-dependent DNA helicase RecQ [Sandaracinaceae bacterium]
MSGPPCASDQRLSERFGLPSFHPWQREAIDALLTGPRRVLVVAPTGGGKSLCYQYPATELPGTTLVVSPLIALMEDQVRALSARGVRATFLASTLDFEELKEREAAVGRGEYDLVYVAPERLSNRYTLEMVRALRPPLVAIDEAHCIAQWGHDFRPEYLRLGEVLRTLNPPHVLACTATATPAVRDEILLRLGLTERDTRVVLRGFARPNLHLSCEEIDGQKGRRNATVAILTEVLGSASNPSGGAIVYAATRKNAETMGEALCAAGFRAGVYHAGMSPEDRADVNTRFASGDLHVVAATNAFGMGIDRADIRVVVHLQAPGSIEAYYQEVGRAGRDGAPAEGVLLASASDMGLRKRLIDLRGAGGELSARQWDLFLDLMRYVEAGSCRHDFILRYFGDDQETLGGCGHCDVCSALEGREGAAPQVDDAAQMKVRQALSGIARARSSVGLRSVAEMLAGKSSVKSKRWGFDELSTFGLFREEGVEWTVALLRRLVTAALADLSSDEYPLLVLTARGVSVMKGELPAEVLLPAAHAGRRSARQRAAGRDTQSGNKSSNVMDIEALDDTSRALFMALREERTALARERGVPPYVVCHDRTLLGLAVHRPVTDGGLAGVHGMGPARIEAYGARLIAVIERSVGLS